MVSEIDTINMDELHLDFYNSFPKEWYKNQDSIPKAKHAGYYLGCNDTIHNAISVEFSNLEIYVDTTQKLAKRGASIPVFIKNGAKDTVLIAYGEIVDAVIEAQDKNGEWLPIEKPYFMGYGTGVGHIMLPPNEIVMTSAVKYTGDFKTQMRIKIGKSYSNIFQGSIHPRQFKSMFTKAGNYTKEYIKEQEEKSKTTIEKIILHINNCCFFFMYNS